MITHPGVHQRPLLLTLLFCNVGSSKSNVALIVGNMLAGRLGKLMNLAKVVGFSSSSPLSLSLSLSLVQ